MYTVTSHLSASSHADEKSKSQDEPPEPGVLISDQLGRTFDDQSPLGEREAEASEGPIPRGNGVTEAHQQQEADPVKEKRCEECPAYRRYYWDLTSSRHFKLT